MRSDGGPGEASVTPTFVGPGEASVTPTFGASEPAERLKQARLAAGFKTAKEFSDTHYIAQATYSTHESGKRGLKLQTAQHYAELLNVSTAWILTGEGEGIDIKEITLPEKKRRPEVNPIDTYGKEEFNEYKKKLKELHEFAKDTEDNYWGMYIVEESSMDVDDILAGDIILVDLTNFVIENNIVLATTDGKNLRSKGNIIRYYNPPFLLARSTLHHYPPLIVDNVDVKVLGAVVAVVRFLR